MIVSLVFSGLAVGSLLVTCLCVPFVRRLATRTGLVDYPAAGAYKTHVEPTPYGGGVAIWIGVLLPLAGMLAWLLTSHPLMFRDGIEWVNPWAPYLLFPLEPWSPTVIEVSQVAAAVIAALALGLLGLTDDRRVVSAGLRLGVQLIVSGLLVELVPGFRFPLFGLPDLVAAAASILWLVALTNAFNFLDNMNGLSAGLAAITIGACGSIALVTQHAPAGVVCLVALGACSGFLLFNFPRASIFMGDAGGLFLGFLGGAVSLLLCNRLSVLTTMPAALPYLLLPLAVFTVPIYDLVTVVGLRLSRGLAPWSGDTNHVSHRLVAAGLSRMQAVLVLYGLSALFSLPCAGAVGADIGGAWWSLGSAIFVLTLFGVLDLRLAGRRISA